MKLPNWTTAQQNAIEARGGTLLVSAAAGSGKTAVLVERVIQILADENDPVDVDQLLIVTFTNAAAAEMRERISQAISARLLLQPDNQHLLRQQMLLPGARICTIDAFCKDLVSEHFYQLQIPQDFRILEESEKSVLEEETLNVVLEDLYEEEDPAFLSLVELLSNAKNDTALQTYLLKLHDYIMAHPFPERWLDAMCARYTDKILLDDTEWANLIFQHTNHALSHMQQLISGCYALLDTDGVLFEKIKPVLDADMAFVTSLLQCQAWDERLQKLHTVSFSRFPAIRGYGDDPVKKQIASVRERVKKQIGQLAELYCATSAEHQKDMRQLAPVVAVLARAVRLFHDRLTEQKKEEGALSFSDIEQFALNLLVTPTDIGYERTQLAEALSSQYRYILIDEYQDTNRAQDLLFTALSNGSNLFMVGDVKQSIYRFRQAMPQIFMEKKEQFSKYNGSDYPAQIVLDRNFRSRPDICFAINYIFTLLFSKEVGELVYNADERLNPGLPEQPAAEQPIVGLHILDAPGIGSRDMDLHEAAYLAQFIQKKVRDGEWIKEKNGAVRQLRYGDFAVLFRSASAHIPNYSKVLAAYGIPVASEAGGSFFDTPEITTVLCLLRILDNPMQDIPLLSVMLSPLFGFTPDELAQMKIADRKSAFYTCVAHYAQGGDEKTIRFLHTLQTLRTYSVTMRSASFLRKLYDETSYFAVVKAMGEAEQRTANLNLLLEYAASFEASGRRGLSALLRFFDKIQKNSKKISGATPNQSGQSNAVKLMSIHRSKGLEFPVCIIAGNSRGYNTANLRENLLLHPELGAGLKVHNEMLLYQYASVPYHAVRLAIKNAEMSENLRVLYVAMTRARDQLYFVLTEEGLEKKLIKLASSISGGKIDPFVVGNCHSDAELLLLCALLHPDGAPLRRLAGGALPCLTADFRLDLQVIQQIADRQEKAENELSVPPDQALLRQIEERLTYRYPYSALSTVAAKRNASALDALQREKAYFTAARPAFLSKGGLTAAQKGSAMHAFMQHCDYQMAKKDIASEADRMEKMGFLTQEERLSLSEDKLRRFFNSPFAERMFASRQLLREIKFASFLMANEVYPDLPTTDEKIYVQGIADCAFVEDGALVVVDYKTDHIKEPDALLARYENQLWFYCRALQRTYQMPVKACYLYSFYLEQPLQYDFAEREE